MPPRGAILKTDKGNPIYRDPARVMFAVEEMRSKTTSDVVLAICERWGVHKSTAWRDVKVAQRLIVDELDGIEVRAAETRRNERIADRAEKLAQEAAGERKYTAAAALQRTAIAASQEISRLTGAYTPTKVQVTHVAGGELPLQLDAILAILDADGIAAMRVVQAQIVAALADGRLTRPEDAQDRDAPAEDAQIVEAPGEGERGGN